MPELNDDIELVENKIKAISESLSKKSEIEIIECINKIKNVNLQRCVLNEVISIKSNSIGKEI